MSTQFPALVASAREAASPPALRFRAIPAVSRFPAAPWLRLGDRAAVDIASQCAPACRPCAAARFVPLKATLLCAPARAGSPTRLFRRSVPAARASRPPFRSRCIRRAVPRRRSSRQRVPPAYSRSPRLRSFPKARPASLLAAFLAACVLLLVQGQGWLSVNGWQEGGAKPLFVIAARNRRPSLPSLFIFGRPLQCRASPPVQHPSIRPTRWQSLNKQRQPRIRGKGWDRSSVLGRFPHFL